LPAQRRRKPPSATSTSTCSAPGTWRSPARKAVLLSIAYQFGKPGREVDDEAGTVRAENDWTEAQGGNLRPRASWAAFRQLPLNEAEFAQIANNVPQYFR
jgi:hypothetical protein